MTPAWLRWILGKLLPVHFRGDMLLDLEDGFKTRRPRGALVAWAWLIREVITTPYLALWRQARRMGSGSGEGMRA